MHAVLGVDLMILLRTMIPRNQGALLHAACIVPAPALGEVSHLWPNSTLAGPGIKSQSTVCNLQRTWLRAPQLYVNLNYLGRNPDCEWQARTYYIVLHFCTFRICSYWSVSSVNQMHINRIRKIRKGQLGNIHLIFNFSTRHRYRHNYPFSLPF